ncbi:hypothetical protein CEXT_651311 [Caerostris extrusa]|uniref:Uncharacterized protein n=1 Tax=Caerostris extrusa TaxID=172846 RepID=A0AAV4T5Z6_CAEEX|nr:hypothetical protein CEXT_651311 [Caerostris extrusa]
MGEQFDSRGGSKYLDKEHREALLCTLIKRKSIWHVWFNRRLCRKAVRSQKKRKAVTGTIEIKGSRERRTPEATSKRTFMDKADALLAASKLLTQEFTHQQIRGGEIKKPNCNGNVAVWASREPAKRRKMASQLSVEVAFISVSKNGFVSDLNRSSSSFERKELCSNADKRHSRIRVNARSNLLAGYLLQCP